MGAHIKLHEREKRVLKLEEESLRSLIFQYQSALNTLKVEELTLKNRMGQSLDRARQSQASTPTASFMTAKSPVNLPTLISKINTTEDLYEPRPLQPKAVKRKFSIEISVNVNGVAAEENLEKDDENQ